MPFFLASSRDEIRCVSRTSVGVKRWNGHRHVVFRDGKVVHLAIDVQGIARGDDVFLVDGDRNQLLREITDAFDFVENVARNLRQVVGKLRSDHGKMRLGCVRDLADVRGDVHAQTHRSKWAVPKLAKVVKCLPSVRHTFVHLMASDQKIVDHPAHEHMERVTVKGFFKVQHVRLQCDGANVQHNLKCRHAILVRAKGRANFFADGAHRWVKIAVARFVILAQPSGCGFRDAAGVSFHRLHFSFPCN